jgi:hypothetical protein
MDELTFPGLIFYIGWQQSSINNINIGLDRFNDSHHYRFYNTDGIWQESDEFHAGSLMMRPIVGIANPLNTEKSIKPEFLSIFPNPVTSSNIRINLPACIKSIDSELYVSIYNSSGIPVLKQPFSEDLMISNFSAGLYHVTISDITGRILIQGKFIKL